MSLKRLFKFLLLGGLLILAYNTPTQETLSQDDTAHLVLQHDDVIRGVEWNADETIILSWSDDNTARLWDTFTGEEVQRFTHDAEIIKARWNADESLLLTNSRDETARAWETHSGEELLRLQHTDAVLGAKWNTDESSILTWSDDETIRFWDTATGEERLTISYRSEWSMVEPFLNDDETRLALNTGVFVIVWDLETLRRFQSPSYFCCVKYEWLTSTHILSFGHVLGHLENESSEDIWDASTGEVIASPSLINSRESVPRQSTVLNEKGLIATWYLNARVRLWDMTSGDIVIDYNVSNVIPECAVNYGSLSPNTQFLTTASCQMPIYILATETGELINEISIATETGHAGIIHPPLWNDDSDSLLFSYLVDRDDYVEIWSLNAEGNFSQSFQISIADNNMRILKMSWSPSQRHILIVASSDINYRVYIIEVETGEIVFNQEASGRIYDVAMSQDETQLMAYSETQLWPYTHSSNTIDVWHINFHGNE